MSTFWIGLQSSPGNYARSWHMGPHETKLYTTKSPEIKRQTTDAEKIHVSYISARWLIPRIYKELKIKIKKSRYWTTKSSNGLMKGTDSSQVMKCKWMICIEKLFKHINHQRSTNKNCTEIQLDWNCLNNEIWKYNMI